MSKSTLRTATLALAAAAALTASSALAADLSATPATFNSATFDWNGFYAGVGVAGTVWNPAFASYGYLNGILGVNAVSGNAVVGGEIWAGVLGYSGGTPEFEGGAEVRAGYLVSPEVLAYLSGGVQLHQGSKYYGQIGAGLEMAVSDNMSVDVQYKYSGWSNTGFTGHTLAASLNWHF